MKNLIVKLLEGNNLAIYMSALIGFFVLAYIIYNSVSYFVLRERYHGIRFTTKNIAYITMFTAVSVSVTIVISLTAPITVFPPIRIAFEGVMVKITGFIFGPIVGVIVGLITEVLVMLFVPSFIHPAFIISVICFGFIAGIGSSFLRVGHGNNWILMSIINVFLISFTIFIYFVIEYSSHETFLILNVTMNKNVFKWVFLSSVLSCTFIIWGIFIVMMATGKRKSLNVALPILLFATATEYLVTSVISAWGDSEFLGLSNSADDAYIVMLMSRLVQAPLKVVFNTLVLYYTYKAVSPLIKRDR
ncbi:hypothetical protein [Spiroplasma clarkii]|nr:hypothetical protein [Spiroplasma clarkii]